MHSLLLSRSILNERTIEIKLYLDFLKTIINKDAKLLIKTEKITINNNTVFTKTKRRSISIEKDLSHTLKANAYLLLYNAIEAVCSNSFTDIHDSVEKDLKKEKSDFSVEKMNINLIEQVLKRFKASNNINYALLQTQPKTGIWLVEQWLEDHKTEVARQKNPLMSGNLDSKQMRELAEKYGFNSYGKLMMPKNKGPKNAKEKRNNLAHGHQSFTDCGRSLTYQDVARDAIGVIIYLRRYVRAVEKYIQQKGYLAQPPALAPQPQPA